MKKVKVQRYISGKRPEYAQYESSDEDSGEEDFVDRKAQRNFANRGDEITMDFRRDRDDDERHGRDDADEDDDEEAMADPRLRRLMHARHSGRDDDDGDRIQRHRHIHEPEIEESESEEEEEVDERNELGDDVQPIDMDLEHPDEGQHRRIALASDSESDPELSDTEIDNRRQRLRNKMLQQRKDEEVLLKEEEKQSESSESDSSEYEEESESETENEPRLKPLFVRKRDRATIAEKEKEAARQRQVEYEAKKAAKEQRRQTLRIVEESIKKDLEKAKVRVNSRFVNV